MTRIVFKGLMGLLTATALLSQAGSILPARAAVASAKAPSWVVNKAASRLSFQSSFGGTPFSGAFARWDAAISFDPANLAGSSVLVKIDMTSAKTGDGDRDAALPGNDWFATAKFAQATFASKNFKSLGGGRYEAIGTLTLRGISRPLSLPFAIKIDGGQARLMGSAVVNRRVFGVGQGQFASAETIPLDVRVAIVLVAKRA